MPRKKRSEETLAQVRRERLNKHLTEVEQIIKDWVLELTAPSPFAWSESEEAAEFESKKAAVPVRLSVSVPYDRQTISQWKQWALHSVYVPPMEQDPVTNHMLRKHLRKRSIWTHHTKWEQKLKRIMELVPSICDKAARLAEGYRDHWEITDDYTGMALEKALDLATGCELEESYSQKPAFSQGVWYGDILIEKSAKHEEVEKVGVQHNQLICGLAQSEEMLSLAQEWREVLALKSRMQEMAYKALKSSDILYQCQFCRRLW